jgi:hypothetical protein
MTAFVDQFIVLINFYYGSPLEFDWSFLDPTLGHLSRYFSNHVSAHDLTRRQAIGPAGARRTGNTTSRSSATAFSHQRRGFAVTSSPMLRTCH